MSTVTRKDTCSYSAAMIVGVICLLAYIRALSCDFIFFDDPLYVQNNATIRNLNGTLLYSAITQPLVGYMIPVTYISYALDYYFWQLNPAGYHLTNIVIHSVNAGLVVLVADKLLTASGIGRREQHQSRGVYLGMLMVAGLLFGLHPLRVESVAWVSGRKDVLLGLFFLGSILCYLRHADRSEPRPAGTISWNYIASLLFYLLAMLSKPVGVVIPAMLLLADWYPLHRLHSGVIRFTLIEKIPFFLMAGIVSVLTVVTAANESLLYSVTDFPFLVRTVVSGNAIYEYCRLLVWPVGISPLNVLEKAIPFTFILKALAVCAVTVGLALSGRKRPWLLATWCAFILPLLPVLAFIQQGPDTEFAARYTYLPAIIPGITAAAMLASGYARMKASLNRWRPVIPAFIIVLLTMHGAITVRLISAWRDTGAFWSRVIEISPLGRAYQERAFFYLNSRNNLAAAEDFTQAIAIADMVGMPPNYNLYAFRGEALRKAGLYHDAIKSFTIAIGLYRHPSYFYQRGLALKALGRQKEAEEDFERAGSRFAKLDWLT